MVQGVSIVYENSPNYVGHVLSKYSSEESTKFGGITSAGNDHVRRILVKASLADQLTLRVKLDLFRQRGVPIYHLILSRGSCVRILSE